MDEILIEEKKYVSSKQAAKMTGYAKDYIGQLCREGRVPARLVGRSWYVLETAIQDHRFGAGDIQTEKTEQIKEDVVSPEPVLPSTWESPRYEPYSNDLQDSWKEWFDRVSDAKVETPAIEEAEVIEEKIKIKEEPEVVEEIKEENTGDAKVIEKINSGEVDIPITRSVYKEPPKELLPHMEFEASLDNELKENDSVQVNGNARIVNKSMVKAVQIGGVLLAAIFMLLAFIGSGYLDKYIILSNQASVISGLRIYNK